MSGACISCGSERRRQLVRTTLVAGKPILNGIDFVEVAPSQTKLVVSFIHPLNAVTGAPALGPLNFRIEGGVRVRPIRIIGFAANVSAGTVTLTVSEPGDFSLYRLRLVSGLGSDTPPATFDVALSALDVDFKAACPNPFDCRPGDAPSREPPPAPVIDYLAKDYLGFRRLMLERMSVTAPSWTERNPADMGVMLVEALAQTADDLSYFQDAVATEAYLGTANKRRSIRGHARLLDYRLDEGLSARTWVAIDPVDAGKDGATIPAGTRVQTVKADPSGSGAEPPVVFETLHDRVIRAKHVQISFHNWSGQTCCLARGATRASLVDTELSLAVGDTILLRQTANPDTGEAQLADPRLRQVVRLTEVEPVSDALTGTPTLSVAWDAEDALAFDLPLIGETKSMGPETPLAHVNANIVLAEQGASETRAKGSGAIRRDTLRRRFRLPGIRIAVGVPYDDSAAREAPASRAIRPDRLKAVPRVWLEGDDLEWEPLPDLLGTNPSMTKFVVESGGDFDHTVLRFGDGRLGRAPVGPVDDFTLHYVAGIGAAGNVGEGTLKVVPSVTGVSAINPLPAEGAREPEPLAAVRLAAPYAFKKNKRCVTPADYARRAEAFPGIQRATAYRCWTGSWYSTFIVVDRLEGAALDARFADALLAFIEPERMTGDDLAIVEPRRVPLDIALRVCLADTYRARDVEVALRKALGRSGFFDPDRFSFGDPVYLSALIAAAAAVGGVDHVTATRFQRWGRAPKGELDAGLLAVDGREIVSCDNDSELPRKRAARSRDGGRALMADPVPQPCGCPPDPPEATPRTLYNAPGQPALAARVGDHAAFLESLLDATVEAPQLDRLKVREGDDFTIGLLDAWAVTLDVLTFYQERIANEGYLGTATERRSVLELARTIGYELAPGVAAEAHLGFGLDIAGGQAGTPGLPEKVALEPGLAAQSIPGPGRLPATFETVEPIEARGAWNSVGARQTQPQVLGTGTREIWLAGLEAGLKHGDLILLVGEDRRDDGKSDQWDVRAVEAVTLDAVRNLTHVTWRDKLGSAWPKMTAAKGDDTLEVWQLGASARLFGATAPDVRSLHKDIRAAYSQSNTTTAAEWEKFTIGEVPGAALEDKGAGTVQIDGAQPLVKRDWLVFARPGYVELYDVQAATESAATAFSMTGKTTLTRLRGENLKGKFNDHLRDTALWRATRRFALGEPPAPPSVDGKTVELERVVPGLRVGQTVAVSEALPDPAPPGQPPAVVPPGEILKIKSVTQGDRTTTITFESALSRPYPRAAFRFHANVARSTHGAAREEVLGSGEASASFQAFTLSDKPLTYVSAETSSGRASALTVWVNRILWREVESFVDQPPDARVYVTRRSTRALSRSSSATGVTARGCPAAPKISSRATASGWARPAGSRTGRSHC